MYRTVSIDKYLESSLNGELCFCHVDVFSDKYEDIEMDINILEDEFLSEDQIEKSIELISSVTYKENYETLFKKYNLTEENYKTILRKKLKKEPLFGINDKIATSGKKALKKNLKHLIKMRKKEDEETLDKIRICCFFVISPGEDLESVYNEFAEKFHILNNSRPKELILKYNFDNLNVYFITTEEEKKRYINMLMDNQRVSELMSQKIDIYPVTYLMFSKTEKEFTQAVENQKKDLNASKFAEKSFKGYRTIDKFLYKRNIGEMKSYLLKKHYNFRYEREYRFFKDYEGKDKRVISGGYLVEEVIFTENCIINNTEEGYNEKKEILLKMLQKILIEKKVKISFLNIKAKEYISENIGKMIKTQKITYDQVKEYEKKLTAVL